MLRDILTTDRLRLRRPDAGDADRLVMLLDNWNVVKWLTRAEYPYRREHAEDFLARNRQRTFVRDDAAYAIGTGDGLIGVISVSPQRRGANLGYWLGEPYWGQGIMTEAAGAVIAEFFEQPENDRLNSGVFRGNEASLALQRRFGFEVAGESSVRCVSRDAVMVSVDTELTRQRYIELKS